jgi:hypothetical protein
MQFAGWKQTCAESLEWNEWTKEGATLGLGFSVPLFFFSTGEKRVKHWITLLKNCLTI